MAKKYDIVNTSKMAMEYDGSLINVEKRATTLLENGRLVAIDAVTGKVRYALTTDERVYLHASVEKMAETFRGLTDFAKEADELVRILGFRKGDQFGTTAIEGVLAVGDKVTVGTDGKVVKVAVPTGDENFLAEVIELGKLGFQSFSFGLDNIPSVELKVING